MKKKDEAKVKKLNINKKLIKDLEENKSSQIKGGGTSIKRQTGG